jgi:hypothetical protein
MCYAKARIAGGASLYQSNHLKFKFIHEITGPAAASSHAG